MNNEKKISMTNQIVNNYCGQLTGTYEKKTII